MNTKLNRGHLTLMAVVAVSLSIWVGTRLQAQPLAGPAPASQYEYAIIHWDGAENTHVVYGDGHFDNLGPQLKPIRAPRGVDERAFYLALAIDALARKGFEFCGNYDHDVVLRRARN